MFGGVTGSGTDLLVAAFQQAGDDLSTAVLKQGLLSDPIDKTLTFFVVFAILGALSRASRRGSRRVRPPSGWRAHSGDQCRPSDAALPREPGAARTQSLPPPEPAHKAVVATVGSIGAFVIGGYLGPLVIIGSQLSGRRARRRRRAAALVRVSFLLTLPIAISVVLVSCSPGRADRPVQSRAVRRDAEGVDFAARSSSGCSPSRWPSPCSA